MKVLTRFMLALLLCVVVASPLVVAQQPSLHTRWVGNLLRYYVGSTTIMDIDGANTLVDIKSMKLNGTAITASAAEVNALAGTGLDATELGYLNGVVAGTSAASKAVVLSGAGKIDTIDLTAWKIGGTSVTATAANLNAVPTATGTGLEIDAQTKDVCSSASTVTLSASAAVQTATITCKDADGNTVATPQFLTVYVADDSTGATVSTVGANGTVSFTTGSLLKADTAKLAFRVITSTGGVAVLSIDNTGGTDHYAHYVAVVLPNGKLKVSLVTDVRSS